MFGNNCSYLKRLRNSIVQIRKTITINGTKTFLKKVQKEAYCKQRYCCMSFFPAHLQRQYLMYVYIASKFQNDVRKGGSMYSRTRRAQFFSPKHSLMTQQWIND